MKAHGLVLGLVFLLALVIGPVPALGQEAAKGRKVVVQGSATVYVQPDAARLTFGVTAKTVIKAREENEKQVKKMKDALTFKGVEVEVVPLPLLNVTEGGDPMDGTPPTKSQHATSLFHVVVREKDARKLREMVAKLSDIAAENGGTGLGGEERAFSRMQMMFRGRGRGISEVSSGPSIEWFAENITAARREAIRKAVQDAHGNAQAAVGDAKLTVQEVRVGTRDDGPWHLGPREDPRHEIGGKVPVPVEVQVTFSY